MIENSGHCFAHRLSQSLAHHCETGGAKRPLHQNPRQPRRQRRQPGGQQGNTRRATRKRQHFTTGCFLILPPLLRAVLGAGLAAQYPDLYPAHVLDGVSPVVAPGLPPGHPGVRPGGGGQGVGWLYPAVRPWILPQLLPIHLSCHVPACVPEDVREVVNPSAQSRSVDGRFRWHMCRTFSRFCLWSESNCACGSAVSGLTPGVQNSDGFKAGNTDADEGDPAFSFGVVVRVAKGRSGDKETNVPRRPPSSVFRPPSSVSRPPSSVLSLPSSVFRLPSSVFRPQSSVFRLPSSVFRPPSSAPVCGFAF